MIVLNNKKNGINLFLKHPICSYFENMCFLFKNPIWPPFKGHNSKRLHLSIGKHPEINDPSYMLAKKYIKPSPGGGGGGVTVGFLTNTAADHQILFQRS